MFSWILGTITARIRIIAKDQKVFLLSHHHYKDGNSRSSRTLQLVPAEAVSVSFCFYVREKHRIVKLVMVERLDLNLEGYLHFEDSRHNSELLKFCLMVCVL